MNKLTLLALLGTVDACWVSDLFQKLGGKHHHDGHHHGHHKHHHIFHQSHECKIPDEDVLQNHEIVRQILQKSYIQSVRGMYNEQYDPISQECFGEWIEPTWQNAYDLAMQFHEDNDAITADQMKTTADMLIDAIYKNHKACQMEKVGDVWKHWCLDNLDTCMFRDGKVMDRIMEHGLDFIGIGYQLFNMAMEHDSCATDEQRIKEIADVVEDVSKASVMLHGFDQPWDKKELDHVTRKEFKKEVGDYWTQVKEAAAKKEQEMKDAMPKMPEFQSPQMPSFEMPNMFGQGQWGQPQFGGEHHHHEQFGWGQPQEAFDFKNFHLF